MSVLKKIAVALVLLALALAAVGLLLPRRIHVERSIDIERPQATVFTIVNSFRAFNDWSPWFELDPAARYVTEGPAEGVGAKLRWDGDPATLGSGRQEIVESHPHDRVRMQVEFGQEPPATTGFTLAPQASGTRVTWVFDSDLGLNPASRYVGLLLPRWLERDFDKGLARLKAFAESLPPADFAGLEVEVVDVAPAMLAYLPATTTKEDADIARVLGESFAEVTAFVAAQKLEAAGPPLAVTTRTDEQGYALEAAIPVKAAPAEPVPADSRVQVKAGYGGPAVRVTHRGPYTGLGATYEKLFAWMAAHGYAQAAPFWDEYASDPGQTAEPDLVTHLFVPVKPAR